MARRKHKFSYYPRNAPYYPTVGTIQENQNNVAEFVSYINNESQFYKWSRDQTYENLYVNEAPIASAIDSFSIMVSEAYNYIDSKYMSKPQSLIKKIKDKLLIGDKSLIEHMVFQANELASDLSIEDIYEAYSAVMMKNGTLFLEKKNDLSLSIIPNARVTVIDKLARITEGQIDERDLITEANFLVIDEGLDTERILNKDHFFILKFRETPVIVEDARCRLTYGIYSVSPLKRAIIPTWYKRIAMANDALWRAKSVPREHHKIAAAAFGTNFYTGTQTQKIAQAQTASLNALASYKAGLSSQATDQAYITLDNVTIDVVEPKSTTVMNPNQLIEQLNQETYSAMNLPQSVVRGVSGSNYASELVISSYTSTKIKQTAKKISKVLLSVIKERLLILNPKFPVDQLDIKVSFTLANSRLEQFKIAQVMAAIGGYYINEIREVTDHEPLPDDLNTLVDLGNKITPAALDTLGELGTAPTGPSGEVKVNNGGQALGSDGSVNYPTTPQSAQQQPTDSADAIYKNSTTP